MASPFPVEEIHSPSPVNPISIDNREPTLHMPHIHSFPTNDDTSESGSDYESPQRAANLICEGYPQSFEVTSPQCDQNTTRSGTLKDPLRCSPRRSPHPHPKPISTTSSLSSFSSRRSSPRLLPLHTANEGAKSWSWSRSSSTTSTNSSRTRNDNKTYHPSTSTSLLTATLAITKPTKLRQKTCVTAKSSTRVKKPRCAYPAAIANAYREFGVQKILSVRKRNGQEWYTLRWNDSEVAKKDLVNVETLMREYRSNH